MHIKSTVKISSIFVAFIENMNFNSQQTFAKHVSTDMELCSFFIKLASMYWTMKREQKSMEICTEKRIWLTVDPVSIRLQFYKKTNFDMDESNY